jgi:hypothetical protein
MGRVWHWSSGNSRLKMKTFLVEQIDFEDKFLDTLDFDLCHGSLEGQTRSKFYRSKPIFVIIVN